MLFVKGQERPPGAGRKPGTPSRIAAANRAMKICQEGGPDPITVQVEAMRSFRAIAAALQAQFPQAWSDPLGSSIVNGKSRTHWSILQDFAEMLEMSRVAAKDVAEFAYYKFKRIDHVGDVPLAPVTNKMVITLNIGAAPPPAIIENTLAANEGVLIEAPSANTNGHGNN